MYELAGNFVKLMEMMEDPEIDQEMVRDTLESVEFDIEVKAENYAKIIKMFNADIDVLKAEESRLENKRKSLENRIDYLKSNLKSSMEFMQMDKIKTPLFSIGIQNNPQSVNLMVSDEDFVEWCQKNNKDNFLKYSKPTIVKKEIMEEIKSGKEVWGATIVQGTSLRIR